MAIDSISISKFIPYDSFMHKYDPRLKLVSLIIGIVLAFLPTGVFGLLILVGFAIFLIPASKLPLRMLKSPLKIILFIIVVLFIINNLTGSVKKIEYVTAEGITNTIKLDRGSWLQSWDWNWSSWNNGSIDVVADNISYTINNGLKYTLLPTVLLPIVIISLRIYLLMIFTIVFTSTTRPTQITNAIESLLKPLRVVKFPVEEIALIISIALRFIPTILEETGMIMNAQASRGVDFTNGNVKQKAVSISTLVIPMFANSFQRADDLANAIEARGYVIGEPRTKYKPFKISIFDVLIFMTLIGMLTTMSLMVAGHIPLVLDETLGIIDILPPGVIKP